MKGSEEEKKMNIADLDNSFSIKKALVMAVAAMILIFFVGNASAITGCVISGGDPNNPDDVFTCGEEVTEECKFNGNLTCEGDGLIAKRSQTRIHGEGYRVEGNGTGTGISNAGNMILEIDDLEIKNFNRGIWLQHVSGKIHHYEINNCNINNNSIGIDIDNLNASGFSNYCTIGNCEIQSNDKGIYVHGEDGKRIKIINNKKICNNAISGIYCEDVCTDCEVDSNEVSENGEGISVNASQWTVESNVVTNNSGSGIYVGECDNVFRSNTVSKNGGNGIHIAGASENVTLEGNTVCFNSPNDIFAVSRLSASGDNNSCENCVNYNDSRAPSGKCCVYPCVGCLGEHTGTLYRCGGAVTESCTFNGDITCPGGNGLIVGADDIVIEGANYTVNGVDTGNCGYKAGICSKGHNNITINNLEVKNFCNGIKLEDGEVGTIYNCTVHDNGNLNGTTTGTAGIWLMKFKRCSITNNTVYNNAGRMVGSCEDGGIGIRLHSFSNDCSITNNTVYNNSLAGIFSKMQCMYNYVAYNNVYENGVPYWKEQGLMTAGVRLQCMHTNHWTVENNIIKNNKGPGVYIRGCYDTLKHNEIEDNSGSGVRIVSNYNSLIGNTICDNEEKDIYVESGTSGNTGDNNTCDMAENYCDMSAGCPPPCVNPCSNITAAFNASLTTGISPLTVVFTDESRTAEGLNISHWLWDFGDGETYEYSEYQETIEHNYETPEPYSYYTVSVNVTGTTGEYDGEEKTDYVKVWKPEAAPNADFSALPRKMGMSPMTVEFTDMSIGEVESWFWDFGDGGTSSEQKSTNIYTTGIYTVSLEVTGPDGSSKETKTDYIVVNLPDPFPAQTDANFFADKRSGFEPLEVTFTDMSRSEGKIDSWLWSFGDGNTSNERNPTHTYNSSGIYNVSLELTNTGGAKARETKTGYVMVGAFTDYFDTGAPENPYPSIFGTHKGKIIPDRDITVNRIYTYPCPGTGGHAEYGRIWNESEGVEGEGHWDSYQGDFHNITISPTITLRKGHEYNYTIITGSYPQIIHARSKPVTGGNITCIKFTDANDKTYNDWIPAIRLWRE